MLDNTNIFFGLVAIIGVLYGSYQRLENGIAVSQMEYYKQKYFDLNTQFKGIIKNIYEQQNKDKKGK